MKKGTFTSVWDCGTEITTNATLDETTGQLIDVEQVNDDDVDTLMREFFTDEDGDEHEVCTECHEYILKTVMKEGVGKTLYEAEICSNPDCDNN